MLGSDSKHLVLANDQPNNNHNDVQVRVTLSDGFKDNIPLAFIRTVFRTNINVTNDPPVIPLNNVSVAAFDFVYQSNKNNNDTLIKIQYSNIADILAASIEYNIAHVWQSCYEYFKNVQHLFLKDWIVLVERICHKLDTYNVDLSNSFGTPHTTRDLLNELTRLSNDTLKRFNICLNHLNGDTGTQNLYHLVKNDDEFIQVVGMLSNNKWWWILGAIFKTIIQCIPVRESKCYETVYDHMDQMLKVKFRCS